MTPLRIIFMGTAELSCASLEKLAGDKNVSVVAVVSQPDKPKGRELKLTPSPVKVLAENLNLPVLQPLKARDEKFIGELRALKPDLMVVVAYGQILPQNILDLPKFGCLNVHTSLLPKYRGAAPIQWAIADGEPETGVTIMKMDAGLDTGPMLATRRTPILPTDDSQILHDRLHSSARSCSPKRFQITSLVKLLRSRSRRQAPPTPLKLKRKTARLSGASPPCRYGTGSAPSRRGRGRLPISMRNPSRSC